MKIPGCKTFLSVTLITHIVMTGYLITHCHVFCINFVNEFALVKDKPVQSPSLSQSESKNPEHVVSI